MTDQFPEKFYPKARRVIDSLEELEEAVQLPELDDVTEVRRYQRPMYRFLVWRIRRNVRKCAVETRLTEKIARADAFDIPVALTNEEKRLAKKTGAPLKRVE
jgi:hypothetical protein